MKSLVAVFSVACALAQGCAASAPDDAPAVGKTRASVILPSQAVGTLPGEVGVTSTGAATYSIPLEVPPGSGGLAPTLSFDFDSAAGNGFLGLGWSLGGLSSITRCPRTLGHDGELRAVRADALDKLCLDGQRLVLVSGTQGEAGSTYYPERFDGSRISIVTSSASGPGEILMETKAGLRLRYGIDAESRLETVVPGGLRTFSWLVARITDRSNNAISFRYDPTDTGAAPNVRARPLDRIEYGFVNGSPTRRIVFEWDPYRPDPIRTSLGGASFNLDRLLKSVTTQTLGGGVASSVLSYNLGYLASERTWRSRLTSIRKCDAAGVCLPATTFEWHASPVAFHSAGELVIAEDLDPELILEWPVLVGDLNGDGRDDLVHAWRWVNEEPAGSAYIAFVARVSTGLGWNGEVEFGPAQALWFPEESIKPSTTSSLPNVQLSDVTGDGHADLIIQVLTETLPGGIHRYHHEIWPFTTEWASAPVADSDPIPPDGSGRNTRLLFVDLDGDNLLDQAELHPRDGFFEWWYRLRTPAEWGGTSASFGEWKKLAVVNNKEEANATSIMDDDGRGSTALMLPVLNGPYVGLRPGGLLGGGLTDPNLSSKDCSVFFDVQGDGLADRLVLRDDATGTAQLHENRGGRFDSTPTFDMGTYFTFQDCKNSDPGARITDVDNDGRQDLLLLEPSAGKTTLRRLSAFGTPNALAEVNLGDSVEAGWSSASQVLDLDGDGTADYFTGRRTTPEAGQPHVLTLSFHTQAEQAGVGAHGDQLAKVVDGLGRETEIHYTTLADMATYGRYLPGGACTYPQSCGGVPRMRVVSQVNVEKNPGQKLAIEYGYEDARFDALWGFLGFRSRWVKDTETGARTYTSHDMTLVDGRYPYRGMAKESLSFVKLEANCGYPCLPALWEVSRTQNSFDRKLVAGESVIIPYVQVSQTREYEGTEYNGGNPDGVVQMTRQVTTSNTLDTFGNVTHTETEWAGADGIATFRDASDMAYLDDPNDWKIGLPTLVSTTSYSGWQHPYALPPRAETREVAFTYDAAGRLYEAIREPNDSAFRLTTRIAARSPSGLPKEVQAIAGESTRITHLEYDPDHTFVTKTTNPAGIVSTASWHPGLGVMLSSQPTPDLPPSSMDYDGFGRLRAVSAPDGTWAATNFSSTATDPFVISQSASDGAASVSYLDRLGRTRKAGAKAIDGDFRYVEMSYDSFGRLKSSTRPHREGSPLVWGDSYEYDNMHRVWRITGADGSVRTYQRWFRLSNMRHQLHVMDADGRRWGYFYDAKGHQEAVHTYPVSDNVSTWSEYGPFDQLEAVSDGPTVRMEYDKVGRRTKLIDADIGEQVTAYDGFDQISSETDGRGVTTTYQYDAIGRLLSRTSSADGGLSDTFTYDNALGSGIGRIASEARGNVAATYTYDTFGRITRKRTSVGGTSFDVDLGYDNQSRVSSIKYPVVSGSSRLEVQQSYAANGELDYVKQPGAQNPFWDVLTAGIDDEGRPSRERLLTSERQLTFEPLTGRVANVTVFPAISGGPSTTPPLQTMAYKYSAAGLPIERTMTGSSTGKETFSYDGIGQLTKVITESANVTQTKTYAYDTLGNMTSTSENGGCNLFYGEGGKGPHVLTRAVCGGSTSSFVTDAAGNQTSAPGRTVAFNSFNKPTSLGGLSFEYDANHQRVRKSSSSVNHIYIEGLYERRVENGTTKHYFYVYGGGKRVATGRQTGSGTRTFASLDDDLLGSPSQVGKSSALSFDAWGQRRSPTALNTLLPASTAWPSESTIGFTGHRHDKELDVIDMGGRVYDPKFKRFLSADPVVQNPMLGADWNHYRYAKNSPMAFTDPSGYKCVTLPIEEWFVKGAVEGGALPPPPRPIPDRPPPGSDGGDPGGAPRRGGVRDGGPVISSAFGGAPGVGVIAVAIFPRAEASFHVYSGNATRALAFNGGALFAELSFLADHVGLRDAVVDDAGRLDRFAVRVADYALELREGSEGSAVAELAPWEYVQLAKGFVGLIRGVGKLGRYGLGRVAAWRSVRSGTINARPPCAGGRSCVDITIESLSKKTGQTPGRVGGYSTSETDFYLSRLGYNTSVEAGYATEAGVRTAPGPVYQFGAPGTVNHLTEFVRTGGGGVTWGPAGQMDSAALQYIYSIPH